ncbi:hypothetical protein PHLCEN_2v7175 [Hermanssonia centrifuga]|uniref:Uncharacterized protein n=1 Tax=Hermanssonia centrifuga TaxID=98765 RepID=A0A2R6NX42_9APHY|nr:hypothetical protein PHLCEN_2v7175 [Hermanssonia centrifuga]
MDPNGFGSKQVHGPGPYVPHPRPYAHVIPAYARFLMITNHWQSYSTWQRSHGYVNTG